MSNQSTSVSPKIRIRGIRQTLPSGYVIGRLDQGDGPAQLVKLATLGQKLSDVGVGISGINVSDGVHSAGSIDSLLFTGATVSFSGQQANIAITNTWFGLALTKPTVSTFTGGFVNQGTGSATDTVPGVLLADNTGAGSYNKRMLTIATPPATPYSYVAMFSFPDKGDSDAFGLGWYDGTNKSQALIVNNGNQIGIINDSSPTANAAYFNQFNINSLPNLFFKIRDDGTNVTFSYSTDGTNFLVVYTIAKSAGYLGSTGYAHPFVYLLTRNSVPVFVTVTHWAQGT